MVARSVSLLAALAATASAYGYEYQNTTTSTSQPAYETSTLSSTSVEYPTTSVETTVYTTVCPATSYSTSGTKTYTSVYTTTSTITSCKGGCPTYVPSPDCEKVRSDCQSKPDANQSYCASLYVQCAGTTSGLNKPPAYPTSSTPATKDCEKVRSDCQSKPDANQSYCASLYVQCAGTTSGLNKPPASTPVAKDCEKVRSDCQSKPDANQSYCASLYVQCAGTTSGLNKPPVETTVYTTVCPATSYITSGTETKTSVYTTTSTITTCKGGCPTTYVSHPTTSPVDACQHKFNICRNGEDGGDRNQARCAAEFAACQSSTKTSAPAPTHTPIDACQNKFNMCRNGEDGGDRNQARCAAEFAACQSSTSTQMTYAPAPTTSTTPVDTCQIEFNKCRNGENGGDRNQSRCAAEFAACQGPTTTEKTAAPTTSATTPVDACQDKFNKCRNGEDGGDRNQSRCASEFAACKGGSGSTVETHPPATSAYKTEGVETHPAQTYPASTLATYTPTTVGAPSATTSSVQYTGAASSLKVGSAGLSGVLALVFLL